MTAAPEVPAAVGVIARTTYRVMGTPEWLAALGDDYQRALLLVTALCDALHELGLERVPSGEAVRQALDKHLRKQRIVAEFNGTNHRELARRYGISARTVRRIVERARRDAARRQKR